MYPWKPHIIETTKAIHTGREYSAQVFANILRDCGADAAVGHDVALNEAGPYAALECDDVIFTSNNENSRSNTIAVLVGRDGVGNVIEITVLPHHQVLVFDKGSIAPL